MQRRPFRTLMLLGAGLFLGLPQAGFGQPPLPGGQADVNALSHRMAELVKHLGEDIASDLARTPSGRHLLEDTEELAQATEEFHESLHNNPAQARQAFAGIEQTWQHLRGQLAQGSTPAINRAAQRVDQVDAQLRQALGLNAPPAGFYGQGQAPTGIADTQRLAHALDDRAEALAAVIQADMARNPNGAALARDAKELARQADAFHDSIEANQSIEVAARAFGAVDALADRLERFVTTNQVPPRVQSAWQAFASVEVLIHQNLGLDSPQPRVQLSLAPIPGRGTPPLAGLSNELVVQVSEFVQVFGPTAATVPEGGAILANAQRLQAAAVAFQKNAAQGLPPNQLAYAFRDVDAISQRLVRRVNRIAQGRAGPNIQQVRRLAGTCEQIHRVLGMPGYAAQFGEPAAFRPER